MPHPKIPHAAPHAAPHKKHAAPQKSHAAPRAAPRKKCAAFAFFRLFLEKFGQNFTVKTRVLTRILWSKNFGDVGWGP